MENFRRPCVSRTIVPGRRIIPEVVYRDAGIAEDMSYLAEKTIDESIMNCTTDMEEKMWRKQGLSEKEIFRRQEERTLKKHAQAKARLEEGKFGAKTFAEMCALSEYSQRESEDEENEVPVQQKKKEDVFAVPAIPKHVNEKSILMSPSANTKGSGQPGLSCSTPKGNKDLSMRSLRTLDISHVVSTDRLDFRKITVQEKTVVIPVHLEEDSSSSLQKTHTIRREESSTQQGTFTVEKSGEKESLQETFTKEKDHSGSLLGTFVKESNQPESLQGTFVVESGKEQMESLQGTFVKVIEEVPQEVPQAVKEKTLVQVSEEVSTINETMLDGERRKSKKMGLKERERRVADLTSSMMSSMIEDIPSPGAHFFKNNRKKMRPTVPTPPRSKVGTSRLSTESDKEKTIDMLSIAEELTIESSGSSFVDPISVNGSRVSPIPEQNEAMEISVTPKSSRRPISSLRQDPASIEKSRRQGSTLRISMAPLALSIHSPMLEQTPRNNYLKPTFSSIAKHKTPAENKELLEAEKLNRRRTPCATPTKENGFVDFEKQEEQEETEECSQRSAIVEGLEILEDPTLAPSNRSIENMEDQLDALSVTDHRQFDIPEVDYGEDYPQYDDAPEPLMSEGEEEEPTQRPKKKEPKRRVGLLSDSMMTVNTPGLEDRRTTRSRRGGRGASNAEGPSYDDSYEQESRGYGRRKKQEVGLQLAKREIIEPEQQTDGLRRSTRTRVKKLRTWMGEKAIYVNSPSGGKRLVGVTDVFVKDKRLCKYRTADLNLAMERENRERAQKRARAAERRRQLALDHSFGRRLNESQEDIVTSDDES